MKKKFAIFVSVIFVVLLAVFAYGYFEYKDVIFGANSFADGIFINGINVSGMTKNQAEIAVVTKIKNQIKDIKIELKYQDDIFVWQGKDFKVNNQVESYIESVFDYFDSGNIFAKKARYNKIKNQNFDMPYSTILLGLDEKIDEIKLIVDTNPVDAKIIFDTIKDDPIIVTSEIIGKVIDEEKLKQLIDKELTNNNEVMIDIPIKTIMPQILKQDLEKTVSKRSCFYTDYSNSSLDRKYNIVHAIENFNGMIIAPNQEVSFNAVTGHRNIENGYKKANIILNGVYVEGVGGGVCQASTTLYNALVCADIEILEVNKHTLPSSYVALGFDAMVNEGTSDLRFRNNTNYPLYIKTVSSDKKVGVIIYGEQLEENITFKTRTEFVEVLLHPGDTIIADTDGKYADKVTYKGEYLRLKYPREGYRVKAYLDKYNGEVLVDSKLLREVTYLPQEGIIVEGTEEVTEGITIPPNTVTFISPQIKTNTNIDNLVKKIFNDNPSNYNP